MLRKSPSKLRCERFSSKHLNVKVKKNCALKYNSMQFWCVFFFIFFLIQMHKKIHTYTKHTVEHETANRMEICIIKWKEQCQLFFFLCCCYCGSRRTLFFFQKIIFGVGFFFFSLSRYFGTFIAVNTHIIIVCRCFFFCCSCWCYFVCWRS